jgi:hypothetical protein
MSVYFECHTSLQSLVWIGQVFSHTKFTFLVDLNYCELVQFLLSMSRTQQKLQAMSAQERLIQEKKRLIEEKMRQENANKHNSQRE